MRIFSDIKVSETILLALIPFFGYIAAFFFELGKFYVLRIPLEYMQLSIELILFSSFFTFAIILVGISVYLLLRAIFSILDEILPKQKAMYYLNGSPVVKQGWLEPIFIALSIPSAVLCIFLYNATLPFWYTVTIAVGLLFLLCGLFFIPPLFLYRDEKNYIEKFNRYTEDEYKKRIALAKLEMKKKNKEKNLINLQTLFSIGKQNPFYSYIKLTIYSIIWAILAFFIGSLYINSGSYSITNMNNKDYLIVGVYSEKFLFVGVDKKRRITTNEFLLVDKEREIILHRENIGLINEPPKK